MSDPQPNSHCSFCGQLFEADQPWPRRCIRCDNISYRNPLPVSVVLLPVDGGLLVVRRAIDPERGKLALPGGFIELQESWQEAGARELFEETGIRIDSQSLSPFAVHSAPDGTILIFGLAPPWTGPLPPFKPDHESSARLVIRQARPMAFSLHTRVVREFFGERAAD